MSATVPTVEGEEVPAGPDAPARLGHQPALDGLRGLAVAAVVLYHEGVSWAPGGFTGVDAFFVVSGFLITTLLLDERAATGRIDLRAFWARRVRRLYPALALLLVAVAAYVAFAAPDLLRRSIRDDALATLAYVANWRFVWSHQSYFEAAAGVSPLRHTWSLAVEEQWYVLWPLVVVVGLRRLRGWGAAAACAVAALASAAWMAQVAGDGAGTSRAYYGTDTRAQALLVGAALAFVLRRTGRLGGRWSPAAETAAGSAGLLGLGVGMVVAGSAHATDLGLYRGGFLAVALAWALVVAAVVGPRPNALSRLLSLRPLVALGTISYGVYLWNWPAVVVLTEDRVHLSGTALVVFQVAASVAAATASAWLLELPVRRGRWRDRPWWRPGALVGGSAVALVVALVVAAAGAPVPDPAGGGFAAPAPKAERAVVRTDGPAAADALPAPSGAPSPSPPALGPDRPLRVTVVGDSVGFSLVWFAPTLPGIEVHSEAVVGCGVVPGDLQVGEVRQPPASGCPTWEDHWRAAAARRPDVAVVALGAWEVHDPWVDGTRLRVGTPAWRRYLLGQVDRGLRLLLAAPDTRVAVLTVPCFRDRHLEPRGSAAERNDPARVAAVNEVLAEAVRRHPGRVTTVDFAGFACPGGRFAEQVDGVALRPDGLHVDRTSAVVAWRWLGPVLRALALRPSL